MNAVNRLLWILIGLVLLVSGVVGFVLGLGAWDSTFAHRSPLPAPVVQHANAPTGNDLVSVGIAGLVVLLLGLLLLRAQLLRIRPRRRMADLRYEAGRDAPVGRGRTLVRSGGLEHGVQRSLETLRGVQSAQAQLAGNPEHPVLLIELEVDGGVQLSSLKSEVRQAIERFRVTCGRLPTTRVQIHLAAEQRLLH